MTKINCIELDQIKFQKENTEAAESKKIEWSEWVYDRTAFISNDRYKDVTIVAVVMLNFRLNNHQFWSFKKTNWYIWNLVQYNANTTCKKINVGQKAMKKFLKEN